MNFIRRVWSRHLKLGRKSKKKQNWRKPRGRHNKMREKRRGYPAVVSIGYGKEKTQRGKINGKEKITVYNIGELNKVGKNQIAVIGKVGKKKKMEIAKEIEKQKIEVSNLNVKKFLKNESK
jgi:large subunit ribosomal protein L32e